MVTNIFISLYVTQLLPQAPKTSFESIKELVDSNFTLLSKVGNFRLEHPALVNRTLAPYYGRPQDIEENVALLTSHLTRIKLEKMFAKEFDFVNDCLEERIVGPLISDSNKLYTKTSIIINKILSSGLLIYWVNNYINTEIFLQENSTRYKKDRELNEPINIVEIEFIFKYTVFGLEFASLVFICELLYFQITKTKKNELLPKIISVFPYTK